VLTASIYVTRKLPDPIIQKLSAHFHVKMWEEEDAVVPREVLSKEIEEADGLLCLLTDQIDREVISKAKNLKVISNLAVGYNNIDIDAASQKGIVVTNTPGVLTETTADLTFALLMTAARRVTEASDFLRSGQWGAWSPMQLTGQDIYGATIGIIGLGRIAEALVRRAKGFDMRVLYHNRTRKLDKEKELDIEYADLQSLLKESDFVCILVPYHPELHHMIGKNEFALMKKEAILVNTARGGLVDEAALFDALKQNQILARMKMAAVASMNIPTISRNTNSTSIITSGLLLTPLMNVAILVGSPSYSNTQLAALAVTAINKIVPVVLAVL